MSGPYSGFFGLTSDDPQDRFDTDDMLADTLDRAVTAYALQQVAYHLGFDLAGDQLHDDVGDAISEDGVDLDSTDAARDFLERSYSRPADWLGVLAADVDRATKAKQLRAAKEAVALFIMEVMA